jgi:hypothetical protein
LVKAKNSIEIGVASIVLDGWGGIVIAINPN